MFDKKEIIKSTRKIIEGLRDSRYATCDIDERLALARMEVANTRAGLFDARDAKTAELYQTKLKLAQEEYKRVLRISRERKVI